MSTNQENNTYKDSAKGIAIFGGLQLYKILLSVVRTKFSAIFLGPVGFGIYSLVSSTLTTIELATNCGLGTSAVKDIAASKENITEVSRIYTVLNRLVWITGIVATLICAFGANWLSISAFGNTDYAWMFIACSISLLFSQLLPGQSALMSGLRKYKYITKTNLASSSIGLITTIIFYWLWGIKAIVAVILTTTISNYCFSTFYSKKIKLNKVSVPFKETFSKGHKMVKMGLFISLSSVSTVLVGYLIRIFISHTSDIATVGLFTAVFSLINTYLGLVFSSVEQDFFPRLSSVANNHYDFDLTIRQQNEIVLHILAPLIAVFMITAPLILYIFYSEKFITAECMMGITACAMFYKVPSWTLNIGFLSKGDTRIYFACNISFAIYSLLFNIVGFYYGGLEGLGVSYIISYIVYMLQTYIISARKYNFRFGKTVWKTILMYSVLLFITYMVTNIPNLFIRYGVGTILLILVLYISLKELNKRLGIIHVLKKKFR